MVVCVDERPHLVELLEAAGSRLTVRVGGVEREVAIAGGQLGARPVARPQVPARVEADAGSITAPMAGRILRVAVGEGDLVQAGDLMLILEAMKMENEIRSPRTGVVERVLVAAGERVGGGAPLVVIVQRGA